MPSWSRSASGMRKNADALAQLAKKQENQFAREEERRRAEETMAVERANALRDMKSEIATLVIDAAAKAVGDRNTEQQDRMLYDKFIAEAGEAHGGKIQ